MNISMKTLFLCGSVLSAAVSAQAAELSIAANSTGKNIAFFKERIAAFEKRDRPQGQSRHHAFFIKRTIQPVPSVARGRQQGCRRLSDRRDLGAAALRPVRGFDRSDQGRHRRSFPPSLRRRPWTANLSPCRCSPTHPLCSTARTFWKNTASSRRKPGRNWARPPRKFRTRNAKAGRRTSGASFSRAAPMKA